MKDKPYSETIIFMDIYMPEMDGLEATKIITEMKRENYINWPLKIIMSSAYNSKEEIF